MGITDTLVTICTEIIAQLGLGGIVVLMALGSMAAPVPNEAIMPFVGFLWYEGRFTVWQILWFSTIGSLIGSLISYGLGAYYGETVIRRWGKFLLLNQRHLNQTHRFFKHHGEKAVFISRFLPIVRHLISIPAGIGRMNLVKFIVYTAIGSSIWNMFLAWVGYTLNSNWHIIRSYTRILDIVVVVLAVATAAYLGHTKFFRRNDIVTKNGG